MNGQNPGRLSGTVSIPGPRRLADIALTCALLAGLIVFWDVGESTAAVLGRSVLAVCIAVSAIRMVPDRIFLPVFVATGSSSGKSGKSGGRLQTMLLGLRLFAVCFAGILCLGVTVAAIVSWRADDMGVFALCAFGTVAAWRLAYTYVRLALETVRDVRSG